MPKIGIGRSADVIFCDQRLVLSKENHFPCSQSLGDRYIDPQVARCEFPRPPPLYALYPSRHLPGAKVRAFIDFVMAAIGPKAGRAP
jgi:hypothetical protein